MILNTIKVSTRFMNGNIDLGGDIYNILVQAHGQLAVSMSDFDPDEAIYSNGFISAIEKGLVPMLELNPTDSYRFSNENEEYHHVIINGECYNVYFKEMDLEYFK